MKKILIFFAIVLLSILIGAIYGIVNDQLTYTISPEYYTRFKFIQFGLDSDVAYSNDRVRVALVGIMATWWMGFFIGSILGLVGFIHKNYKRMFANTMQAIGLAVVVAFVVGLIGLAYGKLYLVEAGVCWYIPMDTVDVDNFIAVGSMHNFSYAGGLLGFVAGIVYTVMRWKKERTNLAIGEK